MTDKILLVDDEPNVLSGLQRQLRNEFFVNTALNGREAIELIHTEGPFAVVVSDMRMPGMGGIELLRAISQHWPDTVRMMLTGNADQKSAIEAVNQGSILRFFTKPCPPETFSAGLRAGLKQYQLVTAERELLERTLAGSVKVLVDILSLFDPSAFARTGKVREWAAMIAERMEVRNSWEIDLAAMLASIGQVTVPSATLEKYRSGAKLSASEMQTVTRIPEIGRNLISNIPRLKAVGDIIYYQNKGFDGSGFPADKTAGAEIPVGARILRVLQDFRSARDSAGSAAKAIKTMEDRVAQYDPEIFSVVCNYLVPEIEKTEDDTPARLIETRPENIVVGDQVHSNIETTSGVVIIPSGCVVTPAIKEQLRNLCFTHQLKSPVQVNRSSLPKPRRSI